MTEQINPFSHDALKREVQAALKDAAIFEIGSYGWLNESEADPEFIGHAMWQIDPPPLDHAGLFGERSVRRRPKDIEKEILTAGEDFDGIMDNGSITSFHRSSADLETSSSRQPNK